MQTNSIWVKSKREIAGIFKTEIVQKADPTFMKILDLFFFLVDQLNSAFLKTFF